MVSCDEFLSQLPIGFEELDVNEAIEVLSTKHVVDASRYFQCRRKQEELTGWIERSH